MEAISTKIPRFRRAWERRYRADTDSPRGICLVTGEEGAGGVRSPGHQECVPAPNPAAQLWSLSTHRRSVPYGKEQNLNAPTGKYAAFA